jgi:outer membrane autotransporter protein
LANGRTALNSLGGEIYADADWLAAHQIANLRSLIDRHPLAADRDPWVEYIDGDARVSSDGNAMGFSGHNDGVFAGADAPVNEQLQVGAFFGNARSTATLANGAYATVSGPQAGLYARGLLGKTDAWYGNAVVGVGNPKVAVYRLPNVGELAYASGANYREHAVGLAAEFGYHANVAGVDMRPFVAYDGGVARRSAVREVSNAPTDLMLQGGRTVVSTATLGMRASRHFVSSSGLGVTPDFTLSVGRRLRRDGTVVDATLPAAPGTAFSTESVRTGRMLASASGGVRLRFTHNVSFSLDGAYAHAKHENDRNVQARLNVTW